MDFRVGQLVMSKQGRDKGKHYLVISIENDFVFLSDGDKMPVSRLKRKNKKHIEGTYTFAAAIAEKLAAEKTPEDVEIKRFIKISTTETKVLEGNNVQTRCN